MDPIVVSYECGVCGKRFIDKSGLEQHLKVMHVAGNFFCCEICDNVFDNLQSLIEHKDSVHISYSLDYDYFDQTFLKHLIEDDLTGVANLPVINTANLPVITTNNAQLQFQPQSSTPILQQQLQQPLQQTLLQQQLQQQQPQPPPQLQPQQQIQVQQQQQQQQQQTQLQSALQQQLPQQIIIQPQQQIQLNSTNSSTVTSQPQPIQLQQTNPQSTPTQIHLPQLPNSPSPDSILPDSSKNSVNFLNEVQLKVEPGTDSGLPIEFATVNSNDITFHIPCTVESSTNPVISTGPPFTGPPPITDITSALSAITSPHSQTLITNHTNLITSPISSTPTTNSHIGVGRGRKSTTKFVLPKEDKRIKENLVSDPNVTSATRPFECEDCGKTFQSKGTAIQHRLAVHEKAKPFKCDLCEKQFGYRDVLRRHIKLVHNKIKPHVCETCGYKFSLRHTLRRHIRAKHPEKNMDIIKRVDG